MMMDSHQTNPSGIKQQGQKPLFVELSDQLLWTQKEAAAMCGISTGLYGKLRNAGTLPGPINGTKRYSAYAVRQALAANPSAVENSRSAFDDWKATHD
jgi:hypothetical protein